MKISDFMHFKLHRFCSFSLTNVLFLDIKFAALLTIPHSIQYKGSSALLQRVVNSGISHSSKVPDHTHTHTHKKREGARSNLSIDS